MLSKSQVKYIQSLSQKKFRSESPLFVVEGPKCVAEMIEEAPSLIESIYATDTEGLPFSPDMPQPTIITAEELKKISHLTTPNKVLALVRKPVSRPEEFAPEGQYSIFLETIQDPGNMGTIIRLADWFGIKQVVATRDSVDFFHPKVVQSTMGSILRVKCIEMSVGEFLQRREKVPLMAAILEGTPLPDLERPKEGVLIIGNESRGISPELAAAADLRVTIPKYGKAESLNAAMASGILLSWLKIQ